MAYVDRCAVGRLTPPLLMTPPPPPPPHFSITNSSIYLNKLDFSGLVSRNRSGRAIWDDRAVTHLAELWKRLYSPTFIAELLGLSPKTVGEAARRAGLPARTGLTLLNTCPSEDPFAVPANSTVASQMIRKICRVTSRIFFVSPRHQKTVHCSLLGRRRLATYAAGFA